MFGLVKQETYNKAINTLATMASAFSMGANTNGINTALYGILQNNAPIFDFNKRHDFVKRGYQGNPDVYSIVDMILTKLAMCPLILYEVTPENQTKVLQYKSLIASDSFTNQIKAKQFAIKALNETYNNNINDLINTPNKLQTTTDWLKTFAGFYLLNGNTYQLYNGVNGADSRQWTEMFTLPAPWVNIISGGNLEPVKGYQIMYSKNYNLGLADFEAKQVSHLKMFNPDYTTWGNQLYGQAPLTAYIKMLIKNNDSRIELNKQIKNGGPMGIFSPAPGAPNIPPDIKDDVKRQLAEARNSEELAKRIIVAMASGQWQQIGLPSTDLQILESIKMDEKDACKAYHFPPQLLANTEASTDNNMGWAGKQMITNCVMPLGNALSDRLTIDLCKRNETGKKKLLLMFDYSALPELAEDQDKVASYLSKSYWITPNEKREVQGYGKLTGVENMDVCLVPNNLTRIDDLSMVSSDFNAAGADASTL